MKWLFEMFNFRLYAEGDPGPTGGQWVSDGEGGRTWQPTVFGQPIVPAPVAPPPVDTGPDFAANRQTANIDRTSRYSHGSYVKALEGIEQQSRASGADMTPGANDYELPDTAFGERLY